MNKFSKLINNPKGLLLGTAVLVSTMLTGCIQSIAAEKFAYQDTRSISESAIKTVNTSFYTNFAVGDWYYKGAEAMNGTINAYIQIPTKLDMNKSDQKNYLRQAICPSTRKTEFWNQLKGIPLSVHIYTFNKKFTVYAHCDNPTV